MRYLFSILLVGVFVLGGLSTTASAQTVERIGDIGQIAIPAMALTATAIKGDKSGAVELVLTVAATQALVQTLKVTVDATRPNGGSGSFPSGHTAVAFSAASFMQKRYGWKYGIPAYAGAALVGWTRVDSKNHYTRDVLVGAGIGIGIGQFLTKPIGKRLSVAPTFGGGGVGFSASINLQ